MRLLVPAVLIAWLGGCAADEATEELCVRWCRAELGCEVEIAKNEFEDRIDGDTHCAITADSRAQQNCVLDCEAGLTMAATSSVVGRFDPCIACIADELDNTCDRASIRGCGELCTEAQTMVDGARFLGLFSTECWIGPEDMPPATCEAPPQNFGVFINEDGRPWPPNFSHRIGGVVMDTNPMRFDLDVGPNLFASFTHMHEARLSVGTRVDIDVDVECDNSGFCNHKLFVNNEDGDLEVAVWSLPNIQAPDLNAGNVDVAYSYADCSTLRSSCVSELFQVLEVDAGGSRGAVSTGEDEVIGSYFVYNGDSREIFGSICEGLPNSFLQGVILRK